MPKDTARLSQPQRLPWFLNCLLPDLFFSDVAGTVSLDDLYDFDDE